MTKFDKAKTIKKQRAEMKRITIGEYKVPWLELPIFLFCLAILKIDEWYHDNLVWDETRATKVLDKTLPKVLDWIEEENVYCYCMDWGNTHLYTRAPKFHKAWARKFSGRLQYFIRDGYENKNYIKTIEKDFYDDEWVKFKEIEPQK